MRNLRYIYQIVTHLCLYPQGDLAFEKMTFNSGNLWQAKCWTYWTQCEAQESWVRQLHPHSVMYFFMTSVQHFLLPCRACFSELFRRINGHKHLPSRKHLKFEWYKNTSQSIHGITLPRIPILSNHWKLSTWSVSMFRLLAVSHFRANVNEDFLRFLSSYPLHICDSLSLYLLASIFFWFKMKTAVNNLFSCFFNRQGHAGEGYRQDYYDSEFSDRVHWQVSFTAQAHG